MSGGGQFRKWRVERIVSGDKARQRATLESGELMHTAIAVICLHVTTLRNSFAFASPKVHKWELHSPSELSLHFYFHGKQRERKKGGTITAPDSPTRNAALQITNLWLPGLSAIYQQAPPPLGLR